MIVEKHSGENERYETFGGKRFKRAGSALTVRGKNKKVSGLKKEGMLVRVEKEGRFYRIYSRKVRK